MKFLLGDEQLDIIHEEPQDNWETIEISLDEECISKLYIIENKLYEYGLTLNDFFIAVIKKEIEKNNNPPT